MRSLFAAVTCTALAAGLLFSAQVKPKTPAEIKADIDKIQQDLQAKGHTFKVSVAGVSERPLNRLAGSKPPPLDELLVQAKVQNARVGYTARSLVVKAADPPPAYDWRKSTGKSLPIQDQKDCGSCWAFATIGAFEGSFIQRKLGDSVNASEQDVLNCTSPCSPDNSCERGWYADSLELLMQKGVASRVAVPYVESKRGCAEGKGSTRPSAGDMSMRRPLKPPVLWR